MKFPIIGDIASRNVASVNIDASISQAINKMLEYDHRNVIIVDGIDYYILTVLDILNLEGKDLESPLSDLKLTRVPVIYKDKNVLDTIDLLDERVEYACVINVDNTLYGIISHTDITSNMDPDILMDRYLLEDFLKIGKRMRWVNKDDITSKLIKDMAASSFDNAVVVQNLKPIGIITTKDIMGLIKNKKNLELPISEYMIAPVDTINKKASIKDALSFINKKHYKRAIVVNDDGTIDGIITQKDIISLTYARWTTTMKKYHDELTSKNFKLENQNKEYKVKASRDSLTGLYNRYKFAELYNSSYQSMIQRENDMSLVLLDIDFFKKVNDTFGHNIGDQVLVQVANSLLKTLRNIDIVCRWGGEEFIVLLPTADLSTATKIAQKIRVNIQELDIEVAKQISVSLGVAHINKNDSILEAVERADKALYLAKESGRNCVKTELDL